MSSFTALVLLPLLTCALYFTSGLQRPSVQEPVIQTVYNKEKNLTTVALATSRISSDKDPYHSLDFSISYDYEGELKRLPKDVRFEWMTVVKARKLNTDLYVLFLLDGSELHFGSNRSAILKPVPGRQWIGERMVFLIPYTDFQKFAQAEKIAIKLGNVLFDLSTESRDAIRMFASLQ